jgi:hypothetical protein
MSVFRRKVPAHYIPVHPDNIGKNDWIILLEAGTIVCPSAEKLRVARATLERKIVTKYNMLLRAKHFLVLEGYDPRIHALYFCPQLYALDSDNRLVPLEGEEIGELLARALKKGAVKIDVLVRTFGRSILRSASLTSDIRGTNHYDRDAL